MVQSDEQKQTKMTKEQFIEKYGFVKVSFNSYFKYTFTFRGILINENTEVMISVGGSADAIYRISIDSDDEYQIDEFDISTASVVQDGIVICELDFEN